MEIKYKNKTAEKQCTDYGYAKKHFNQIVAEKLFASINFVEQATCFLDIVNNPTFKFHDLKHDGKGTYSIDLGRKIGYRLIIEPLDENEKSLGKEKNFELIKQCTKIVLVVEVTNHYD